MAQVLDEVPVRNIGSEAQQFLTRASDGRAAKALRLERESVLEDLKAQGAIRTATIVNFNPVWLKTTSAIPDSVPPYNWQHLPEDMAIEVEHKGQKFRGSYLTITEPYLFPWPRGTRRDDGTGEDVLDCTIDHVLPLGRVLDIWMHYNKSGELPTGMGGILIFEGNRKEFGEYRKPKMPAKIKVPVAKKLANGKRSYYSVEQELGGVLEQVFTQQRLFTSTAIQTARAFYADENQRKDITDQSHRVWGHYGMSKGWGIETHEPWMLADGTIDVNRCEFCGEVRKDTKAHFCKSCNAPYDAYASFMAGMPVAEQYLYTLKDKELKDVQNEMKRRKALFADLK